MKNSLEIVLVSEGIRENNTIVEWIAKNVLPLIAIQEHETKKLFAQTLTDSPAIYLS